MNGVIETNDTLMGKITTNEEITATIDYVKVIPKKNYEGPYTIKPSINQQVYDTNDKTMINDLTIQAIPYFETNNEYGKTVYIGKEEDYGN